ncbi:MAG TPA: septum formation initiator family protein [Pelagibacteraceae bacterium]|jgi:cell division protein FtsB|nr:septum formation initiator family protein [Pelagibacteraceae bacterium]|tara:strand:+ start:2233 stop:2529 length:297 start_codon:yes stop_codon:yes gene_type:complete
MRFVQIINQKKFTLIIVFLFLYVLFNFLDGERGLISYYEKQKNKEQLIEENKTLSIELALVEKKNMLLTDKIDLDYLEILYRQKFMFGKSNEYIYKSN